MKNLHRYLAMLFVLFTLNVAAQNLSITGVVLDEEGEPVIGASIIEKGTTNGTITDFDGKFSIKISTQSITVSFIGMKSQDVNVKGKTNVKVVLANDNKVLEEVVVVGYGTVRRKDIMGSVTSVSAEALTAVPVASVTEAMAGKLAGVSIAASEGDPDADVKIRVRGGGSITQDNSPLYIVDGFPVESISDIPSSDIHTIDVLKDAFSTAIYGSRGANGVVIVTTKSGESGKCKVSYNAYIGYKKIVNKDAISTLNSEEYVKYQYELAAIRGRVENDFTPYFGNFQDIDLYDNLETNDWIDQVFGRTGNTFNHNINVSGGSDKVKWSAGYSHIDEKAIMLGSNYSRDNLNLKTNFTPNKKISFDFSVRYSDTDVRGAGANSIDDACSNSGNGRLKHSVLYSPIPRSSVSADVDLEEDYSDNVPPVTSVYDNETKRSRSNWNANAAFNWEIVKNLKLRVEAGIDTYTQEDNKFYGMTTYYSRESSTVKFTPSAYYSIYNREKIRNTNTLSYDFKEIFGGDSEHNLNVMIGQEYLRQKSNTLKTWVDGLPTFFDSNMAWKFMSSGSNAASTSNFYDPDDLLLSFFGRFNYDYLGKYSVSGTMRADGSSKFLGDNRWGYFPSAAVAWRISDEGILKDVDFIDNLKIRYSYGTAGNNGIPSGQTSKVFSASTSTWIEQGSNYWSASKTMSNPDLKWETTISNNIGLDFAFWNSRISGSIEVYQNNIKDLLINFPVSGSGYDTQYRNLGENRNRGIEFSLSSNIIQKKDYGLSVNANISFNKNKILSLGGLEKIESQSYWASTEVGVDYVIKEGGKLGDMYGYLSDGFYTADDFLDYAASGNKWVLKDGVTDCSAIIGSSYLRPGAMKLKDITGDDGKVTVDDKTIIGNALPTATGGFSINGYFKGFDFGANFNFVLGNNIYNANKIEFTSSRKYSDRNAIEEIALGKRWTNIDWTTGELVNDATKLAEMNANATIWSPAVGTAVFSDWAVEDGSFLRLSSATIGYTLPKKLTGKFKIERLRLYATGTNLFCLTKYTGFDPEVDTRRATTLTPGVDYSAYPRSIGWVVGLNLNF